MIKGKVKIFNGMIFSWELEPDKTLTVNSLVVRKFNAKGITHSDQVIRLIDDKIAYVSEYQIEYGKWKKYR